MTEDITFCQNGWEECQVTRCERHPSNIENPQLPHSYAKLYRMEYCPLEKPQQVSMNITKEDIEQAIKTQAEFEKLYKEVEPMIFGDS